MEGAGVCTEGVGAQRSEVGVGVEAGRGLIFDFRSGAAESGWMKATRETEKRNTKDSSQHRDQSLRSISLTVNKPASHAGI